MDAHPGHAYLGALPHDEVLSQMRGRRVVFSASWVEVLSLVDLEAASAGCRVVATTEGHSREWMPGSITTMSPHDLTASLLEAQAQAHNRATNPAVEPFAWTWSDVAERLEATYERAMEQ